MKSIAGKHDVLYIKKNTSGVSQIDERINLLKVFAQKKNIVEVRVGLQTFQNYLYHLLISSKITKNIMFVV